MRRFGSAEWFSSRAKALREPIFIPYAGRKACPLMLPMQPLVLEASNFRAAFEMRDERCERQRTFLERHGLLATGHALAHDADVVWGCEVAKKSCREKSCADPLKTYPHITSMTDAGGIILIKQANQFSSEVFCTSLSCDAGNFREIVSGEVE